MEREFEVVELDNGKKLPVIDAINYQDRTFILVGVIDEEEQDVSDELFVYEKIEDNIVVVDDNDLLEKLMVTFENRLSAN